MDVLTAVLGVFTAVGEWIRDAVLDFVPMFYNESGLTFLGVMCVASLAFAVCFLMVGLIQKFLKFKG